MSNGLYSGTYIGKSVCGLTNNHHYTFEINKNGITYELRAFLDGDNDVNIYMYYSSEISIMNNWILDENETIEIKEGEVECLSMA